MTDDLNSRPAPEDPRPAPRPFRGELPPPRSSGLGIVIIILVVIALVIFGVFIAAAAGLGRMASGLGRPLRIRGRHALSRHALGDGWHDDAAPRVAGLSLGSRIRLAHRWLLAARMEHASIPAFTRLAGQLAAIDAPSALIARCHDAARDEDRHARRCFALARAYSGVAWTAGRCPSRARIRPI